MAWCLCHVFHYSKPDSSSNTRCMCDVYFIIHSVHLTMRVSMFQTKAAVLSRGSSVSLVLFLELYLIYFCQYIRTDMFQTLTSFCYYRLSPKICRGEFEVNSHKKFSFHVNPIYAHTKLNFLATT